MPVSGRGQPRASRLQNKTAHPCSRATTTRRGYITEWTLVTMTYVVAKIVVRYFTDSVLFSRILRDSQLLAALSTVISGIGPQQVVEGWTRRQIKRSGVLEVAKCQRPDHTFPSGQATNNTHREANGRTLTKPPSSSSGESAKREWDVSATGSAIALIPFGVPW